MDTELIVLNTTKLGESSLVLHALSREHGRRSFVVKVSRRTPMSLFLPLNILEADVTESPKSTLWRAGAVTARYPLGGIRSNIHKNTMTLFMSEVLYRAVKDGAREEGLYEWCERSILTLDAMERDYSNYHLRFLLEFASALGFSPSAESLAPFAGQYYRLLSDFVRAPFAESMLMPMNGEVRNALSEILLKYIAHHSESSLNVQSLKVLRELYA
jgi:DNA repair protein RecO (recombination protein O)